MPLSTTYGTTGNREDILDLLTRVEPEVTPFTNSISKGPKPKAMLTEYQVDDLDNPTWGGVLESEDVSTFTDQADGREMLSSRPEKFRDKWMVSTEQELVSTAGVKSEKAYAKAKSFLQLKIKQECAFCSDQEAAAQSGSTPYKMRGLVKWIDNTNTNIPSAYRTPSASIGTTSSLTEATFGAVLQSVYEQHGAKKNYRLFAGPTAKKAISDFHRADTSSNDTTYTVTQAADSGKVTLCVMRYESDWGNIDVINSLFIERTSGSGITDASRAAALLIDPSLVSIGFMKMPTHRELEDAGGGPRGYWESIATVIVKNPLGLGRLT